MGNKWKKRAAALLSALLAVTLTCATAFAASVPDLTRTGSVTVSLKNADGEAVSGGSLTLYQVAAIEQADSGLSYVYTEEFAECGSALDDLSSKTLAEELASWASDLTGTTQTLDENGSVQFTGLELGLYLLVQEEAPEGYEAISPFLVTVPLESDDGEDGYLYDVDATAKAETYTGGEETMELTVEKVWNDGESKDKQSHPDSVTVELYRGDEKVDSVVLSESNDWTYTWTELKNSSDYSVKEVTVKGWKATYTQDGNKYTVTNTYTLPQTGQLNWPVPVLAGCGLVLLALGWVLRRSGRQHEA